MWPTLLKIMEFVPVAQLLPVVEKYLSKNGNDDASLKAMDAMAGELRGDLGQVTASHAALYRQLNDQSEKLADVAVEVRAARAAAEAAEARMTQLERRQDKIAMLLLVVTALVAVVIVIGVVILRRMR